MLQLTTVHAVSNFYEFKQEVQSAITLGDCAGHGIDDLGQTIAGIEGRRLWSGRSLYPTLLPLYCAGLNV